MIENAGRSKKYYIIDCIAISFRVSPLYTIIIAADHIISALLPALTVVTAANFIDTAVNIFNGFKHKPEIYPSLIGLILIILYDQLHRALIFNFAYTAYEMALLKHFKIKIIEKQCKLEYMHLENKETKDLISRAADNPEDRISVGMYTLFNAAEIIITIGSLSIYISNSVWWAGILIAAVSIPFLFVAATFGKEVYSANIKVNRLKRQQAYYEKVLKNREYVEERALFDFSSFINNKWRVKYEEATKISLKTEAKNFIRMKIASLIIIAFVILFTGILLLLISENEITLGIFAAMTTTSYNLIQLLSWKLAYVVKTLSETRQYLKDLTQFMNLSEKAGALEPPSDLKNMSLKGTEFKFESVEFKNVCFRYPGTDINILDNFNLKLVKNKHYAIVGVNGAGKTTLIKILTGMYDNYTGEILINERNLKEYSLPQLKAIISVVFQDFARYFTSLEDNLTFGNSYPSQDIHQVIGAAGLTRLINELPDGLNTYLGKIKENGLDLSMGEWQKIALARCLLRPALLRILDEPAAALDPSAESKLYKLFGELCKEKTTIFITHRLGAAVRADEIIVISDGKVAEKGSHLELLQYGGIYSEMFESQRSWYQE